MKQHWELVADLYDLNKDQRRRVDAYAKTTFDQIMQQFVETRIALDAHDARLMKWPTPQESEEL